MTASDTSHLDIYDAALILINAGLGGRSRLDLYRVMMREINATYTLTVGKCKVRPYMYMHGWVLDREEFLDAVVKTKTLRAWTGSESK